MEINLEIPDQNIDTEGWGTSSQKASFKCVCSCGFLEHTFHVLSSCIALQVVFGSLYRDDVLIKPSRVVSILAAACMLQLVSMLKVRSDRFQCRCLPSYTLMVRCDV